MKKHITALLTISMLISSCTSQPCTLIPCQRGINVELNGTLPTEFSLAIKDSTGKVLGTEQCSATKACTNEIFFPISESSNSITVDLTKNGNTISESFTPEYKTETPNGSGCGECQKATIKYTIK